MDLYTEHFEGLARRRATAARRSRLLIMITLNLWLAVSYDMLYTLNPTRTPYHTSALSGAAWVLELLLGHPKRIRTELGVTHNVFSALIEELQSMGCTESKFVTLEEQVAIFLYMCVTGNTIRHTGERFQRSNETISRYFRQMVGILSCGRFYNKYVVLPDEETPIPRKIRRNPKFRFFKDAIGALDGSHIAISPPKDKRGLYRNRKGFLSQNCLFACNFDFKFVFALTGWEGSATDAKVWDEALAEGDFEIPDGKYYLGDGGYPSSRFILIPYREIRYHLAEWGRAKVRPVNKEELFNLRHASLRNEIERLFGVLKRRFRILLLGPEYSLELQARIPAALAALHNFILTHEPTDQPDRPASFNEALSHGYPTDRDHRASSLEAEAHTSDHDAEQRRDKIAEEMWADYVIKRREMGIPVEGDEDDEVDEDDEDDESYERVAGSVDE